MSDSPETEKTHSKVATIALKVPNALAGARKSIHDRRELKKEKEAFLDEFFTTRRIPKKTPNKK